MLEYLNRSLAGSTAPSSRATATSPAASGKARCRAQKSPSRPSRTTPPPWQSNARSVTAATGEPSRSGSHWPTGSSSRSRPASASWWTTVAVKVLECDATWNRWLGVSGVPVARSATPYADDSATVPSVSTAACTPGTRR